MSDLEILAMWLRVVSFSQLTRRSRAVKIYLIWVDVLRIVFSMDILYFTWNMLQYVTIYMCTLCMCVYILNQEQAFHATDEFLTTCRDSWTPCGLLGCDYQLIDKMRLWRFSIVSFFFGIRGFAFCILLQVGYKRQADRGKRALEEEMGLVFPPAFIHGEFRSYSNLI